YESELLSINATRKQLLQSQILIQIPGQNPEYTGQTGCLQFVSPELGIRAFDVYEKIDSNGFYLVDDSYPAMSNISYTFYFYPTLTHNSTECASIDNKYIVTPQLIGNNKTNPWRITRSAIPYVGIKIQVPSEAVTLGISVNNSVSLDFFSSIYKDDNGYFYSNNYLAYYNFQYDFIFWSAPPNEANISNQLPTWPIMRPDLTNDPWVVNNPN
ncbi:15333_t:CDS:2, partial [Gigaspora rosea]